MKVNVSELKPYELNKFLFDESSVDYKALKGDIETKGIKVALHILPNKTILAGHNRWSIAKELGIEQVPCEFVTNLKSPEEIKEYVIKDNLFRRQLNPQQRYFLWGQLSKKYEFPTGKDRVSKKYLDAKVASSLEVDVNIKTAKDAGTSPRNIARARQYCKLVEKKPELIKEKVTKVLREVKRAKQLNELHELKPVEGKFNVIVIDPPWGGAYEPDGLRGAGDYPTMTFEEIKKIDLPAADDCVLWLWGIDLYLKETLEILEGWGFERKSTLIWVKDKIGLGHWLRNQHEYCFLAIKGKPVFHGESTSSVLNAPRRKHSEKPDEFYKLVEKVSPYKKKLDYFSRKKRDGWECYGDEVE